MKTEGFSSKEEMEQAIKATEAKFVLYVNTKAHIHRVGGCGYLWQNRKTRGSFGVYSIYQTYDEAEKDAIKTGKTIKPCAEQLKILLH